MASVFCEHRRVKTTCPECKPRPAEAPSHVALPSGDAPAPAPVGRSEPEPAELRGPGKPLMPTRKRARKVTAADAAKAEAWWVKRD